MTEPMSDFDCVICERRVDCRWEPRRTRAYSVRPPVCRSCEGDWGKPAQTGAFADRRTVAVGSAIAEALASAAGLKQWKASR